MAPSEKSAIRKFFSFRTSYFNTNIQSVNGSNLTLFSDSVDNTTKKRRRRNQNQQQTTTTNNNSTDEKANSNDSSTVVEVTTEVEMQEQDQEQDEQIENSDVISDILGHFGWWQFIWTLTLSFFQFPSTFHLFSFVFEVSE